MGNRMNWSKLNVNWWFNRPTVLKWRLFYFDNWWFCVVFWFNLRANSSSNWTFQFFFLVAVAVAVAFFLCWAPFHSQRLMAVYGKSSSLTSDLFRHIYTALTYVSGVLYFMSTCINPLLYSIMSRKFRTAFKVINFKCQLYL